MKSLLILGDAGRWPPGVFEGEIWACGRTYRRVRLTRLFEMHDETVFGLPDYGTPQERADLDIPVYMQAPHPLIPKSLTFPLDLFPRRYFTGTIAYMLALGIQEGFERIILRGIHCVPTAAEYVAQKACLDYWCGVAEGRGIEIITGSDSWLMREYPWQPKLYGYHEWNEAADQILVGAIKEILHEPRRELLAS